MTLTNPNPNQTKPNMKHILHLARRAFGIFTISLVGIACSILPCTVLVYGAGPAPVIYGLVAMLGFAAIAALCVLIDAELDRPSV